MAQLLKDVLDLDERSLIDRAQRALWRNLSNNKPPRHLLRGSTILILLDDIIKKVMSAKDLTFQGQWIQIFRDLPREVVLHSPRIGSCCVTDLGSGLDYCTQPNYGCHIMDQRCSSQNQKRPAAMWSVSLDRLRRTERHCSQRASQQWRPSFINTQGFRGHRI